MITSSVGNMASGSVRNQAEQTEKDVARPPSVLASSLSDSDGDHAGRVEGIRGGGTNGVNGDGGDGGHGLAARGTMEGPRVAGRVKWFNFHKGFGFITMENNEGEVFVHQSNIKSEGFRSLREDEEVEFDLVIGEDGKRKAFNVTGPDGRPPQGAIQGGMQSGAHHLSPNMHRGMPGMMMNVVGPNAMGSISPQGMQVGAQAYGGEMNIGQMNGVPGGEQGQTQHQQQAQQQQQPYYSQMPPMAYYQQPAYYQLNEAGYPQAYPMSPSHGQQGRGYYGGRGWYGAPRPPPPGTPGFSSGLQVVVHNLPWDCSWQVLRAAFEDIGPIERADVVFDSHGRSRGFGVVRFADQESAQKAVEKMNDQTISGRVVSVRVDRFA